MYPAVVETVDVFTKHFNPSGTILTTLLEVEQMDDKNSRKF